ncbi:hypothetical protein GCM10007940_36510 [Portibacter lacus]|uniref:Uncharacterized protein n=1 Tax=Portibacter lacus TaxID=1099794 RepID=A0AA37WHR7_9BACT|nr:hypothetical protein GCM10007940_36510 [Portibacter lacus]
MQVGSINGTERGLAETEITSVENEQGQEFINSWRRVIDNPVVRLDLPSLEKLAKILDPIRSPKLLDAGFNESFMKSFIKKMNDNGSLYSDIADPGKNNGLQVLLNSIEKMEGLTDAAKLPLVRSGLQSTDIAQLRGELFRLRRCEDYGWENLRALEEYIKAAPNSGYTKGRHPDISPLTPPPHFIETKYYSILLREKTVDAFAKQLHKDLLDVFRIIDEGIVDAPTAFKSYLYEFKKSSEITSNSVLAKQVEDIFTKSPWKDQLINGKPLSTIKIELDNLFIQKSGGNFEDLLDFIFESNAFKVID